MKIENDDDDDDDDDVLVLGLKKMSNHSLMRWRAEWKERNNHEVQRHSEGVVLSMPAIHVKMIVN